MLTSDPGVMAVRELTLGHLSALGFPSSGAIPADYIRRCDNSKACLIFN
jgi:hypothetical protein